MTLKKQSNPIKKIFLTLYEHTEGFLMAVFTLMLVTDVLLGILARYVHFEVVFATELGKYLFIWLCAIGISAAAKDHQHVRLNFFVEKLPISRRTTWILSQVLFLVFTLFFCYWGLRLTLMHFEMNKSVMGFHFPMFVFTAALPIGFALTSLRLILDIIHCLKKTNPPQPWIMPPPDELTGLSHEK
jgi:TRAP-type C4-dicarboxylate transport system permease small subunit